MVHFVGAGPGAPDLITVRGKQYLEEADVVIYAGSLVNPKLLEYTKDICTIHNSAKMTLEEVIHVIEKAEAEGKTTVRLHTGDPCIYGAIREQMDILDEKNIAYDYCPGVSAFCGAASALNLEYTLPDISQSVIITRMEGRTPVPSKESIQSFAAHQATMVVFLSTGMLEELSRRLIEGGYTAETPAAIVYKATWPEQKTFVCTVGTLAKTAAENNITKTALMIIGDTVAAAHYDRSKLYDPEGIRRNGELVMLVFIQDAASNQMTLYYLNLIKILCGLVEVSLLRALEYQEAVRDREYLEGTHILKTEYFMERLKLFHSIKEQKIGSYALLQIENPAITLEETDRILRNKIRENDILGISEDGQLYLILSQVDDGMLPIVIERIEKNGLHCRVIDTRNESRVAEE